MEITVHTDNNIRGTEEMTGRVEAEVASALSRFSDRLTRVDVHLSDQSAGRVTESDIRCLVEARPRRRTAVTVTDDAGSVDAAVTGALQRLDHLLTTDEGRRHDRNARDSIRGHDSA